MQANEVFCCWLCCESHIFRCLYIIAAYATQGSFLLCSTELHLRHFQKNRKFLSPLSCPLPGPPDVTGCRSH